MKDTTVLITGASRGIGAATARHFAALGANVVLAARSTGAIEEIASDIGDRALAVSCDVSRYDDVKAAVTAATDRFGGLDVLIGNAGVIEPIAHLSDVDPDEWDKVIDINLKGVFHGMRAALPVMKQVGSGTIITISSGAATSALEGWSHYCASKAAALMLTRAADKENRDHGIRVLGLSPGTVATDMQHQIKASGMNPVARLDWSDHIPPDWPARALAWMCTADADGWLGQDISLRNEDIRLAVGLT
ncbi:SDR family oxidoreductase [Roseovarius atlanticus]|uniref:SDR family oxidoreductase n=1 Tax=Roseovarius atlanticus TaxID=1641875 RepID=UPI001C9655A2|nr:SDR family oxidoreductase [Roseovarius atlanticus]MBY5990112.1 SDR family oxidoreductase [Roseovarius atlanticus]MBY6126658.1 SDR family oxidoreductase [Roseovarius atlanticus]MBY6151152.1 SDR family oxidoreductase [Roseovarius atlanticus]